MADYLRRLNSIKNELASKSNVSDSIVDCAVVPSSPKKNKPQINSSTNDSDLKSSTPTSTKTIEQRVTIIKTVPLDRLVWAPNHNIKGGGHYVCARICDIGEGVTEFIEDNKWPMQDDEVLVEYFNLPTTFLKVDVVKASSVVPYYENPRASKKRSKRDISQLEASTGDSVPSAWNEDGIRDLKASFRKRFSISQAESIQTKIIETANSFLDLALKSAEENRSSLSENENRSEKTEVKMSNMAEAEDYSKYARVAAHNIEPLKIGDVVEYYHKIFRNKIVQATIQDIILEPEPYAETSLGDKLESNDTVFRGDDSGLLRDYFRKSGISYKAPSSKKQTPSKKS